MTDVACKNAHVWARDQLDWYVEPERATESLLTKESFFGRILDPACGQGNIVRVLRRHGLAAFGSDVVNRGLSLNDGWLGERDFLADAPGRQENIVCNPPFFRAKGAESFIRRALDVASRKVAMFVDIKFLAGGARGRGLWSERPPHRIYILSDRPSCPPGEFLAAGNTASNGTADWIWLVWDRAAPAYPTQLGWLRKEVAQQPDAHPKQDLVEA